MSISSSRLCRKNSFEKRAPAQIYFGSNSLQKNQLQNVIVVANMGVPSSLKLNHKNSNDGRKESFCQNRMNLNRPRSKNGPTVFDKISKKKKFKRHFVQFWPRPLATHLLVPARLPDNFKNCVVVFFSR